MTQPRRAGGFYDSPQWKAARLAALTRDGWRCTICGASIRGKGQSRVDHIQPLRTHPHLRLTLRNLRSLCTIHDGQAHRERRWGNAGKRDARFGGSDVSGKPLDPSSHWYKL